MIILIIRTDNPQAEIGLYDGLNKLDAVSWHGHRQLAETIHLKLKGILESNNLGWQDLKAVCVYAGPGSFTGLRICITVANTLADSLSIPIVSASGEEWARSGIQLLLEGKGQRYVVPEYGSPVHITEQKK